MRRKYTREWKQLRERVFVRDGGICVACEQPPRGTEWHLGHLVDRYLGGADTEENTAVMCAPCNILKPPHRTMEDYRAWLEGNRRFERRLREILADMDAELRALIARAVQDRTSDAPGVKSDSVEVGSGVPGA